MEYHEKLLAEQNASLKATLKRLQDQALEQQVSEDAESDEDGTRDQAAQEVYKAKAEASQVNISVAHAKQEELQRLIAELNPRHEHAL